METIIKVKDVSKQFKGIKVLDNINLTVEKGSICGLTGANGSGKTVLMKAICGFLIPDSGEIYVREKKIGEDCDFPENTGVIIENPGFSPYISGFRNLKGLASIRKKLMMTRFGKRWSWLGSIPKVKNGSRNILWECASGWGLLKRLWRIRIC